MHSDQISLRDLDGRWSIVSTVGVQLTVGKGGAASGGVFVTSGGEKDRADAGAIGTISNTAGLGLEQDHR